MNSNSQIFTTNIFGVSSGDTKENLIAKDTSTIEQVFLQQGLTKMNNKRPRVPSNQKKFKGS